MEDFFAQLPRTDLLVPALVSASGNGAAVDLHGFDFGTAILHLSALNTAGTTPTLAVQIQDSPDGVNWNNTANAAFAPVGAAGSSQSLSLFPGGCNRYVRAAYTLGGTNSPAYVLGLSVFARPQIL